MMPATAGEFNFPISGVLELSVDIVPTAGVAPPMLTAFAVVVAAVVAPPLMDDVAAIDESEVVSCVSSGDGAVSVDEAEGDAEEDTEEDTEEDSEEDSEEDAEEDEDGGGDAVTV